MLPLSPMQPAAAAESSGTAVLQSNCHQQQQPPVQWRQQLPGVLQLNRGSMHISQNSGSKCSWCRTEPAPGTTDGARRVMQCCCWLQHPALPHCMLLHWLWFALCTGLATSAISSTAGAGLAWQWHPPTATRLALQVCAPQLQLPLYAQQTQCWPVLGLMVV